MQFHVEVSPDMVAEWVAVNRDEVARELPPGAGERMIELACAAADLARRISRTIFDNAYAILGVA